MRFIKTKICIHVNCILLSYYKLSDPCKFQDFFLMAIYRRGSQLVVLVPPREAVAQINTLITKMIDLVNFNIKRYHSITLC